MKFQIQQAIYPYKFQAILPNVVKTIFLLSLPATPMSCSSPLWYNNKIPPSTLEVFS